jgi:hypothetical protein
VSEQLVAGWAWWRRWKPSQDPFDPVVQLGAIVEDGDAIEQADAADRAPEDQVVMRRTGQGADEREERTSDSWK